MISQDLFNEKLLLHLVDVYGVNPESFCLGILACFYEDGVNFSLMVYLINEDGCEPNNGGLASPERKGQPY